MFKDIVNKLKDKPKSNKYYSFINNNKLSKDIDSDLLKLAYWKLNKIDGICTRCLEPNPQCKYIERKVEIVNSNIHLVKCKKTYTNNLYPNLGNHTFNNYYPQNKSQEESLSICKLIANKFKEDKRYNILLYGDIGCGKSHLCSSLFTDIQCKKHFVNFTSMINEFRNRFTIRSSSNDIINKLRKIPLLYIDDLGKIIIINKGERSWIVDLCYDFINYRLEHNKQTIYTSNKSPNELEEVIGIDVVSRIKENTLIRLIKGNDYRKQQGKRLLDELSDK